MAQWVFESLSKAHDRKNFSCGVPSLDDYLKKQANQDQKRSLAFCYVLIEEGSSDITGYYTLSAPSLPLNDLHEELKKKLRYDQIPAALIGRLAVSQAHQGKGFGKLLLMNAFDRLMRADLACSWHWSTPKTRPLFTLTNDLHLLLLAAIHQECF